MRPPLLALLACFCLASCEAPPNDHWLGYVEGEMALIAAPQPGWITSINVARGARVKPGDALFTLDAVRELAARDNANAQIAGAKEQASQAAAQIAQAQAQQAQIEADIVKYQKELARQEELVRIGGSPRRDLEAAQAAYDSARAQRTQTIALQTQAAAARRQAEAQARQGEANPRHRRVQSVRSARCMRSSRARCRTSISAKANTPMPARRSSPCCRPPMCSCAFSCRSRRTRQADAGKPGAHQLRWLRRRSYRHDQLHRLASRIHAAGHLQRRQSREAGVQGRSARGERASHPPRPPGGSLAGGAATAARSRPVPP